MARPTKVDVNKALSGLRINQNITTAMLPEISFSPTLGITARRIDKLGMDIRSFREPLRRSIKDVMAPSFRKNFDEGGRPKWDPLSPATPEVQERIHHVGSHDILVKTGLLRRVMGQVNIWTITQDAAVLKHVPVEYAAIHQAGYQGSGGKQKTKKTLAQIVAEAKKNARNGKSDGPAAVPDIPARPFAVLQEEDVTAISAVFDKWLGERIDHAWPR